MSFRERAENMGLQPAGVGDFIYSDRHSRVKYSELRTRDEVDIPHLGVFTSPPQSEPEWKFCSIVSDGYRFIGNEVVNEQLRNSISDSGAPLLEERNYLNPNRTQIRSEMIISNPSNVPRVGDVYPQVVVNNAYDGTRAVTVAFGLAMRETNNRILSFAFHNALGLIRQIHFTTARSSMATSVGQYVQLFNQNILEMIEENFNKELTEDDIVKTLDLVEKMGKRRRNDISVFLSEVTGRDIESEGTTVSAWQMFLAIVKYSSSENNLNAKTFLENAAERILVVPQRMMRLVT